MNRDIVKHINDVELLISILDPADKQGFDLPLEAVQGLQKEVSKGCDNQQVVTLCQQILSHDRDDTTGLFELLQRLVNESKAEDGSAETLIVTPETQLASWDDEILPSSDPSFVQEFFSNQSTQLEELEGLLLSAQQEKENGNDQELSRVVKSYLHNAKGESAVVGLGKVSEVIHATEDAVVTHGAARCVDALFAWKEWILKLGQAYAVNQPPEESSVSFLKRFHGLVNAAVVSAPPISSVAAASSAPKVEESNPEAPGKTPVPTQPYKITGEADILVEFIAEANEHLNAIEQVLMEKEYDFSRDDIDTMFRAAHSIKGGASYFGLIDITRVAHITETLMDKSRDDKVSFRTGMKAIMLVFIDLERELMQQVKGAMNVDNRLRPYPEAYQYIDKLTDLLQSAELMQLLDEGDESYPPPTNKAAAPAQVAPVAHPKPQPAAVVVEQKPSVEKKTGIPEAAMEVSPTASKPATMEKKEIKNFVKVDTDRLDKLIEYIGEMVISSSMLIRSCQTYLSENDGVTHNAHQLEQIVREIQDIGLGMRLVPIKGLFQKMSRVVWDISKKIKKDVVFKTDGDDTELDRTVIDKLADPLMHMVRNAADHGIETPDERVALGKQRQGTVRLSAYHQGGNVFIEIHDDGRGLDPKKLIKKAIEKGVLSEGQTLSDQEAFHLIFAAGFSTAEKVTDVSGRGVGMDVVRRNIESMRGRIHIDSKVGSGSIFKIELPLTLAIMDGLGVAVGSEKLIIPTHSVVEFLKVRPESITRTLDRGETLEFRGKFLPIYRVGEIYGIDGAKQSIDDTIVAVVEHNREYLALILDEVTGKVSTVIKSLGGMFRNVKGLSGCSIMPDASIGLILDVAGFVSLARSGKKEQLSRRKKIENTMVEDGSAQSPQAMQ